VIWKQAVAWTIAGVAVLSVYRLGSILALDLESLISNFALDWTPATRGGFSSPQAWFADPRWIAIGKELLAFGALPLVALTVGGLISKLLGVDGGLAFRSRRLKQLLTIVAPILFAMYCIPFSLALTVWAVVEGFVWIQWYGNVDPMLNRLYETGPYVIGFAMALLGYAGFFFALAEPSNKPISFQRRLVKIVVGMLLLVLAAPLSGLILLHGSRVAFVPGRQVFEASCEGCHVRTLPFFFIKTPAAWERTIDAQVNVEGVELSSLERAEIIEFLNGMRGYSDSWIFTTRCGRCHGMSTPGEKDRTPEDWAAIVDRIARWSPYYYRPDIRDQLVAHLTKTASSEPSTFGQMNGTLEQFKELENRCAACHTLSLEMERYDKAGDGELLPMIARMNAKSSEPLAGADLDTLAEIYQELSADPARFDRLFPHDRPVDEGGLPW
jgi:hypothetical protein